MSEQLVILGLMVLGLAIGGLGVAIDARLRGPHLTRRERELAILVFTQHPICATPPTMVELQGEEWRPTEGPLA